MAVDICMVDIIEEDIITIMDADIDPDTIITMGTDTLMGVVIEHNLDNMDIIGTEMTTITVADIEIIVETIPTEVIITVETIPTIEVITTTETVAITTELPDHVQQVDSTDRAFYCLSYFMRGSTLQ